MTKFEFPLNLTFKITTLSNDFVAKDAEGNTIAYVKQKSFKLKEEVEVFKDESREVLIYKINADKWLDFSAAYSITDVNNVYLGKVVRKGLISIWKAEYDIIDQNENLQYKINEENPWIKLIDSVAGAIVGYFLNPSYIVTDNNGNKIVRLKKLRSIVGRKFVIEKISDVDSDDEQRILLSLMMMILLERRRG